MLKVLLIRMVPEIIVGGIIDIEIGIEETIVTES